MTKELIERLRDTASKGVSVWGDLQMEAAKEIEILTAEREAYASAMDRMKAELAAIKAREPLAYRWRMNGQWHYGSEPLFKDGFTTQEPLYTTPPQHQAAMEALRKANIDCVNHFDAIKEDYDKAQAAMKLALEALRHERMLYQAYSDGAPPHITDAIAALEGVL